jgi:hypothetical protein
VETNQDEVAGLLEVLQRAVEARGVTVLDHHPYFEIPEGADVNVRGAVYNLKFAQSKGVAVHNFEYIVSLLQLSYQKVAGIPVPNADIIPPES